MYNPYQYQYPQGQQNVPQSWQQTMWQPAPAPQPEPQPQMMAQQPSDIAQAIHRLCDILEARNSKGGGGNA